MPVYRMRCDPHESMTTSGLSIHVLRSLIALGYDKVKNYHSVDGSIISVIATEIKPEDNWKIYNRGIIVEPINVKK
jgi:hypothetical protein